MKWVWLIGAYISPICFVLYFAFTHLFRSGATVVGHREMFWLCICAVSIVRRDLFEYLEENF